MKVEAPRRELGVCLALLIPLAVMVGAILAVKAIAGRRTWSRYERERAAVAELKRIATAQSIFREGDKDQNGVLDYGTLAQLARAGLIDEELGTGTKNGYLFEAAPSSSTSEFLWFATATPETPGVSGDRYYATNQSGVIFYTTSAAVPMNTGDCPADESARPRRGLQGVTMSPESRRPSEVWTFLAFLLPCATIVGAIVLAAIVLELRRPPRHGSETAAIGTLKTIAIVEAIFRERHADRDGVLDYGTLDELARAELVDDVLASGTKQGYVFEVVPSTSTSEFLWFATARPEIPGVTGDRYFCTNQSAVIFHSVRRPAELNDTTCAIPADFQPVGK
jgi:hypothetical protein